MQTYPIPMVPGPVRVPKSIRDVYQTDFGSGDLETTFLDLYAQTEANLKTILGTQNSVVIQSGEGMLALWSALKSCLLPGDKVLAVATGVFGYGIADMARSIGAEVQTVGLAYDETLDDMRAIEPIIAQFKPKMITAVHCETPSGTLNPLAALGNLKQKYEVPLFYVDAVASAGGVLVLTDDWHIDLCLGGSQKCLSAPPGTAFVSVSDRAWEIIDTVQYVGYDALQPFQSACQNRYFPYTPYWAGIAALNAGARALIREGLPTVFARHQEVGSYCRAQLLEMGFDLFPAPDAVQSPTVTAVNVPPKTDWPAWDAALRQHGLVVGGSFGPLAGKIFRLGHMGSQANLDLMTQALDIIKKCL
jgi:aspartate aminotransferase-like enzyme